MKSFIRELVKKAGKLALEAGDFSGTSRSDGACQIGQLLLAGRYKDLVHSNKELPCFRDVGFRCYSQFEEDGILLYIFSLIGTTNRIAVEMCAGIGSECNTANLIINHGWHGFLFDGDAQNIEAGRQFFAQHKDTFLSPPKYEQAWITAENVNELLAKAGVSGEVDLLSLDIDGVDYWVWKAIDSIQPRVVVCETHNVIPANRSITIPYRPDFRINTPDFHSASLAAMAKLANAKGYRLVGSNRYGFNAFFVRKGIAENLLSEVSVESCLQDPYSKEARERRWPKVKDLGWVEV